MEENKLRQKDLLDIFGTESIASDVLNGKRELTKEHIRRLSKRFGVSPAAFFTPAGAMYGILSSIAVTECGDDIVR